MSQIEEYYVLFDPIKERYYGNDGVGHIFARAAKPFLTIQAALNVKKWWLNSRFTQVRRVILTVNIQP